MTPKTLVTLIRSMGNMTQKQVATACGLPQSMISKIERDKVEDIMSKSYLALFRLYHEILRMHAEPARCVSKKRAG
jgi:transcriptional regulator with XRE-family HTH domain